MQTEEKRRCLVQTEGGGLKAKVGGLLGVGQAVLGRGWHPGWSLTLSSLASFITKINRRVDRQGQGLPAGLCCEQ